MDAGAFIFGVSTACLFWAAVLASAFLYWRHKKLKSSSIKGYLDLIPDLTGEQRQKVQGIRAVFLPEVQKIRQEMCQKRMELARALFAESADRLAVHAAAEDILKCQSELEHAVIEHILEEKEILGERQRRKFFSIILQQFAHGGLGVHDIGKKT
jgi:Spy/CpxP family protein refolding chaperone